MSHEIEKQKSDEIFLALGKYVQAFEGMVDALRQAIVHIFNSHGLTNYNLIHIVLADQSAHPLAVTLRTILPEIGNYSEADYKIIQSIFKSIKIANEQRNEFLHATWYIGWGNETTDYSKAARIKNKKTKTGIDYFLEEHTAIDMNAHTTICNDLSSHIMRLTHCILKKYDISKNFTIKPDGTVCSPDTENG